MSKKKCIVIKDYKASTSDPIRIEEGDLLEVEFRETYWKGWIWCRSIEGKEGWIPKNYIQIDEKKFRAIALRDYDAIELTVKKGEKFTIKFEESGWAWVSNKAEKTGWIPLENIKII